MGIEVKHSFESAVPNNAAPGGRVQPSAWNDPHQIVLTGVLKALDELAAVADKLPIFTSSTTADLVTLTEFARTILAATSATAAREATGAQAQHPRLSGLAALLGGSDQLPYSDSAMGMAQTAFTAFARSLLAAVNAAAARSTLGAVNIAGDTMSGPLTLSGDPASALQAATKQYVDNVAAGLDVKPSAKAASTANVDIASAPSSLDSVAGVALDRWLLKNQTDPAENGIYTFNGAGSALTRVTDMDSWAEVPGSLVLVEEGAANADSGWVCAANAGGTLGTTAIQWSQFFGTGLFQPSNASLSALAALASIANLTALAGLTGAADRVPAFTGPGAMALRAIGAAANNLVALDGAGKLPALDASQLLNLPSAAAATQAEQESASSNAVYVSPGRQQYHPSSCKGWGVITFSGSASASYNVSSVTDHGSGNVGVSWATVFSSDIYAVVCSVVGTPAGSAASTLVGQVGNSLVAGSASLYSVRMSDYTAADGNLLTCSAFGDQ